MTLELKHLAPYLPYGLEFECIGDYEKPEVAKMTNFNNEGVHLATKYKPVMPRAGVYREFYEIKPVLRPLSDLINEIEFNGEKFVPTDKLDEEFYAITEYSHLSACLNFDDGILTINLLAEPLEIIQKLFEWHFDVFGLIEKGLAIDKNTLNR